MFGSLGTVSCQNDPTMPQHRPNSCPILGAATASSVPGATESFAHVPRVLMATNPGGKASFKKPMPEMYHIYSFLAFTRSIALLSMHLRYTLRMWAPRSGKYPSAAAANNRE